MKRILIVGDDRRIYNGWSTMTKGLEKGFTSLNHKVKVLEASNSTDDMKGRLKSLRNPKLIYFILDLLQISRTILSYKPDRIIIIPEPFALHLYLLKVIGLAKYSLYNAGTYSLLMLKSRGIKRQAMNGSECHYVMSNFTSKRMKKYLPSAKYKTVYGGVDKTIFFSDNRKKTKSIIFNGNLKSRKGFASIVAALKHLTVEESSSLELKIVGSYHREDREKILKFLRGSSARITFTGVITENSLADLYRSAMLNILLSKSEDFYFEGFGLIHVEAIACGTMSVGSLDSGNECAIQDGNGYLVNPDEPMQLADIIRRHLHAEEAIIPSGENVDTWRDVAKRFIDQ